MSYGVSPVSLSSFKSSAMTCRIRRQAASALLLAALLGPCLPGAAAAQEPTSGWTVGVAGAAVSRYIWRGELLDRAALQPDVSLAHGAFTVGVWSSWGLYGNDALDGRTFKEIDTYVSWVRDLRPGELTLNATDYYFPGPGDPGRFSNFGGVVNGQATGAHTVEVGAAFAPSVVPLTFMVAWNVYNDPDHSLFAQVSSQVSLPFVDLDGDIGFLLNDSPHYYGNRAGHAMDYTLRATRTFSIGTLKPYVSAAVVRSVVVDGTYGVFAVGF